VSKYKDKSRFLGKYLYVLHYQLGSSGILPSDDKIYQSREQLLSPSHPWSVGWQQQGQVNPSPGSGVHTGLCPPTTAHPGNDLPG